MIVSRHVLCLTILSVHVLGLFGSSWLRHYLPRLPNTQETGTTKTSQFPQLTVEGGFQEQPRFKLHEPWLKRKLADGDAGNDDGEEDISIPFGTADSKPYTCIIYMDLSSSAEQRMAASKKVNDTVDPENVQLLILNSAILYIRTALTEKQQDYLSKVPGIGTITADKDCGKTKLNDQPVDITPKEPNPGFPNITSTCSPLSKRAQMSERQGKWLTQVSRKRGTGLVDDLYVYDDSAGEGTAVYILDSGLDVQGDLVAHWDPLAWQRDIINGRHDGSYWGRLKWINAMWSTPFTASDRLYGHGTCAFQYVASTLYGIARRALIAMAKMETIFAPGRNGFAVYIANNAITIALGKVVMNLDEKAMGPKAIVLVAFATEHADHQDMADLWRFLFEELRRLQAVVVVAAGDQRLDVPREIGFPSKWKLPGYGINPPLDNILVVGGTTLIWEKSRGTRQDPTADGSLIDVWALGEDLVCMGQGGGWYFPDPGTSVSAASAAGLAAYFMGLPNPPNTAAELIRRMKTTAWGGRSPLGTGPSIISNGILEDTGSGSNNKNRRARGRDAQTAASASTTSGSTITQDNPSLCYMTGSGAFPKGTST